MWSKVLKGTLTNQVGADKNSPHCVEFEHAHTRSCQLLH